MAKPAPRDDKKKAGTATSGIGGLLPMIGFALAALAACLLAAATLDLKFVDMRPVLHGLEPVFALLLIGSSSLCFFASSKVSANMHKATPDALAALRGEVEAMLAAHKAAAEEAAATLRSQTAVTLKDVSQKVETFIGGEHVRLKEENDRLRGHLEGLQRQDAEKIAGEMELLRQKNAELEERITLWAVGSIDSRIERKTLEAA
jgi:hypothetical protein